MVETLPTRVSTSEPQPPTTAPEPYSHFFSARSQRQLSLFGAGAAFFALTTLITRRSIVRRYRWSQPSFYTSWDQHKPSINGAVEAAEALSIATINVASVGMMAAGGILWALDISSAEDLKKKVKINLPGQDTADDKETEKEIEEWAKTMLARKEFRALWGDVRIETAEEREGREKKVLGETAEEEAQREFKALWDQHVDSETTMERETREREASAKKDEDEAKKR